LLLLLDYWPLNRFAAPQFVKIAAIPDRRRILYLIIEKIPFFALAVISSVITFIVQKSGGALADINILPLHSRVANAFLSYAKYIGKMFWPENLAVFYPLDARTIQFWQVVLCALLMIVVSVSAIRFGRKQKCLFVGWFWFVGTLIPVIGLVQVGSQSLADRYTYIPYIGLFIMIAWGLPELLSKWTSASSVESPQRKIALGLLMAIVLTTLGICAHQQASYWNNSADLFSHAIEVTQNNILAYRNLGAAYDGLGRHQDSVDAFRQAIRIEPDFAEAHLGLGVAYGKLGRYQDAVEAFKQAIRIKPDLADAHYNLGAACGKLGRYQDAVESYNQAIRIEPDFAEAYLGLGVVYGKLGHYQDAVEAFKQAIRIKPDYADAHYSLGIAYFLTGDKGSALEEYNILKTLDMDKANKLFNLINK